MVDRTVRLFTSSDLSDLGQVILSLTSQNFLPIRGEDRPEKIIRFAGKGVQNQRPVLRTMLGQERRQTLRTDLLTVS